MFRPIDLALLGFGLEGKRSETFTLSNTGNEPAISKCWVEVILGLISVSPSQILLLLFFDDFEK
jgi:hypothetical protein